MSRRLTAQIRPLAEEELEVVESHLNHDWGNPQKHKERLERQGRDKLAYLIAWVEGLPVGHATIVWGGTSEKAVADKIRHCPNVEDLFVHPDRRSQGIGTQLLRKAEVLAKQRGYDTLGLGVAIDNPRAPGGAICRRGAVGKFAMHGAPRRTELCRQTQPVSAWHTTAQRRKEEL